ncbi:hypothetical protein R3P38DRAFT_2799351 [Favolaschia claudopus]|uniref:Uncharacterized protein n=1 Tax=Favolaschia claudopus TaxID=2862362 RepID=A0AAW0A0F5_9AGAR
MTITISSDYGYLRLSPSRRLTLTPTGYSALTALALLSRPLILNSILPTERLERRYIFACKRKEEVRTTTRGSLLNSVLCSELDAADRRRHATCAALYKYSLANEEKKDDERPPAPTNATQAALIYDLFTIHNSPHEVPASSSQISPRKFHRDDSLGISNTWLGKFAVWGKKAISVIGSLLLRLDRTEPEHTPTYNSSPFHTSTIRYISPHKSKRHFFCCAKFNCTLATTVAGLLPLPSWLAANSNALRIFRHTSYFSFFCLELAKFMSAAIRPSAYPTTHMHLNQAPRLGVVSFNLGKLPSPPVTYSTYMRFTTPTHFRSNHSASATWPATQPVVWGKS